MVRHMVFVLVVTMTMGYIGATLLMPRKVMAQTEAFDAFKAADLATDALMRHYWNPDLKMFNNQFPCDNCNGQFHYWWQAHAIDALLDAFERTGDDVYLERVGDLYAGLRWRNGGHLFNDFYDDEEWMAIALLRAYTLSGDEEYLRAATMLWHDIKGGWNDFYGGGIAWRKSQRDYKNTPANAPAAILAARLYQVTKDEVFLDWAKRIFAWLKENLIHPQTGIVWDGINRTGDGQIDKSWLFTYNQGTVVGAAIELWRATQDETYLHDATRTAHTSVQAMTAINGVFPDEGQGDGGLFKGIFVRYLVEFVKETGDQVVRDVILRQAESLWPGQTDQGIFGPRWTGTRHAGTIDLSTELSAVMLFNLTALMKQDQP